ncbi:MAG: CO/xanthine dehydrogenase Mo-binding subunit [Myxococcota bacterium]|jgi:CO/xanthine dehydrogenase Mo-binding subunit
MAHVGSRVPRRDGRDKVTGKAIYIDDIVVDDMLFGQTVRSTVPHARLDGITLDPDYDWTGITVVTAKDMDAWGMDNVILLKTEDQPALVHTTIMHAAEPVALVACASRKRAIEAAEHVFIQCTPLPAELDMSTATKAAHELHMERGDMEAAFGRADHIFEAEYRTGAQEQLYIEPQGMLCIPHDDGSFTLKGSLQCPYYVVTALRRMLGLSDDQIAVIQTVTGGGFGGKEEYPSMLSAHACLLAKKSGRPVKMVYERDEDLRATTKRHPSIVRHRTGVMADGTLVCNDIDVLFDAGAYITLSPVVLSRGILHATGPYRFDAVRVHGRAMLTNSVPAGAFRGFGAPQVTFAYERHLDLIARELGLDPLAIRMQNSLKVGDVTASGQILKESVAGTLVLERAVAMSEYEARRQRPRDVSDPNSGERRRRGVGVSYFFHGCGFTGNGESWLKGKVAVELLPKGRVRILSGSTDIGQGTMTIFPQIAADTLGIDMDAVEMATPNTAKVPDSGPTVASRTAMVVGKVVFEACQTLKHKLDSYAPGAASFQDAGDAWLAEHGPLRVDTTFEGPEGIEWDAETYTGDAYPCYGWAADVVEVEVDLDTAEVFITGFHTAQDAGTVLHPTLVEGQVEGGSLQALGHAVMEQVVWRDGVMLNDRLTNYVIPTSLDAPEMHVEMVEVPYHHGPFGAKGIGEMPMDGGAAAVAAAVEHALGVPIPNIIPLTPERLLPALEGLK